MSVSALFGGETKEQKRARKAQEQEKARAESDRVEAVQQDVGTRTSELIRKYGVRSAGAGAL
jgi:hypothetical protein